MPQKKWVEVNDLSSGQYSGSKNVSFKTSMLRSDLCDSSDPYVAVKRTIDLLATFCKRKWQRSEKCCI